MTGKDQIIYALENEGYEVYDDDSVLSVHVPDVHAPRGGLVHRITEKHLDDIYDIASMYDSVAVYKESSTTAAVEVGV